MAQGYNTQGMILKYAPEATAGTRPTTGYIELKGINKFPAIDSSPDKIESTTFANTEYKSYIAGLKDLDTLDFGMNLTEENKTLWDACVAAYTTASAAGKVVWFEIAHPSITESFYFSGEPSALGLPEAEPNALLSATVHVTTQEVAGFNTKSTHG